MSRTRSAVTLPAGVEIGMGDRLVEDRQAVAARALGGRGDDRAAPRARPRRLRGADAGELLLEQVLGNAAQVEALAAAEHGDRQLVDLGGREEELHVRRRFLKRLEQGVESVARQHVDFVDDVDLVARADRGVAHRLDDLAHVVDAGVAGGVHLDHVDVAAFGDGDARLAHAARIDRRPALPVGPDAVERLGDQPRGRGLADPAHAGHQEGMRQPLALDRVGERAHHRLLADQLGEGLRAVLAGEHAVGLRGFARRRLRRRRSGRRRLGGAAEQRRLARGLELGGARLGFRAVLFPGRLAAEDVA